VLTTEENHTDAQEDNRPAPNVDLSDSRPIGMTLGEYMRRDNDKKRRRNEYAQEGERIVKAMKVVQKRVVSIKAATEKTRKAILLNIKETAQNKLDLDLLKSRIRGDMSI